MQLDTRTIIWSRGSIKYNYIPLLFRKNPHFLDPRMNKAVAAQYSSPKTSLFDNLIAGGFKFYYDNNTNINELKDNMDELKVYDSIRLR